MQPEYIEDFTIDPDTAVKHKAACVWTLLSNHYSMEQLDHYCSLYGISAKQALRFPPSTPSHPYYLWGLHRDNIRLLTRD